MRASSTATTRVQPYRWRASSATASRVSTGSTGRPRPPRAPYASPWATAQAVRRPVNEPGPRQKTSASSLSNDSPACAIRRSTCGISKTEARAPPGPGCCQTSAPCCTAMERVSVLVSKASRFMGPGCLHGLHGCMRGRGALPAPAWAPPARQDTGDRLPPAARPPPPLALGPGRLLAPRTPAGAGAAPARPIRRPARPGAGGEGAGGDGAARQARRCRRCTGWADSTPARTGAKRSVPVGAPDSGGGYGYHSGSKGDEAMTQAYVFDALRTPRGKGKKDGRLHEVKPIDLLAGLLHALQARQRFDTAAVDDVVMGIVSPVGEQGSVLPKVAALKAGWDFRCAGVQINRFCASGLEAVNLAAQKVRSGWEDLVVAGGGESMSRVPLGSDGGALAHDPETTLATLFGPQGIGADLIATLDGLRRADVDAFALESQHRASAARASGYFAHSVVPVRDFLGQTILDEDEFIKPQTTLEGLAALKPSFETLGGMGFDAVALQRYPQV